MTVKAKAMKITPKITVTAITALRVPPETAVCDWPRLTSFDPTMSGEKDNITFLDDISVGTVARRALLSGSLGGYYGNVRFKESFRPVSGLARDDDVHKAEVH